MLKRLSVLLMTVLLVMAMAVSVSADEYYTADNGYMVIIEDDADLLSSGEEKQLLAAMSDITVYGNVMFKSVEYNPYSTEVLARATYKDNFGAESGTLFMIDMDNRYIYIFSDGAVYSIVTDSMAEIITDNSYMYASDGDYYECARFAFSQIKTILDGNRIAQPMKYISNGLLALATALLINFGFFTTMASVKKARNRDVLKAADSYFSNTNVEVTELGTTKSYSPVSSGSSGGSGGHSSGGGGGGGHSSGGGGGHRF